MWPEIRSLLLAAVIGALPIATAAQDSTDQARQVLRVIRDQHLKKDAKGLEFEIGRALFERIWVPAPASTQSADGLGPLFNAKSCASCHPGGGRSVIEAAYGDDSPGRVVRLGVATPGIAQQDPIYGEQLQTEAVPGLAAEAEIKIRYVDKEYLLADDTVVDLRQPHLRISQLAAGPLAPEMKPSLRLAPAIQGIGPLNRIPVADILANADPDDKNGDGIKGRPNWIIDPKTGQKQLGRFGWKATQPSLSAQDAHALFVDIGLSNPLFDNAAGDCTAQETECRAAPSGASPQFENLEVPSQLLSAIDRFVAEAVLPGRPKTEIATVERGKLLFAAAGCPACHVARFELPARNDRPAREIAPYTDLLLHDMGDGLADEMADGTASGRDWRTAPLWGLGWALEANGEGALLHDGRARSVLEAVLWHGGEAESVRNKVIALSTEDRAALITFLKSL